MNSSDDQPDGSKPFLAHLEDFRNTVLWCVIILAVGMVIAGVLAPRILELLKRPVAVAGRDPEVFLKVIHLAGGFSVAMRIVLWGGILLSIPGLVVAIGSFVFPGLTERERRVVLRSLGFAGVLFAGGVCMGYFMTMPIAVKMMLRINDWLGVSSEFVDLGDYVSFVLKLLLTFGIVFEMPVVVVALGSAGILNSTVLREKRRHVIVLIMIVSMFLTPQDPFTMLMMAAPLIVLYEVCILIIRSGEMRKRKAAGQ